MPFDHLGEGVDDQQRTDVLVLQHGLCRVTESEAAHDHLWSFRRQFGEGEVGQLDLGDGEQARHQELVVELDLVDVRAGAGIAPPAQGEFAQRGLAVVEFLETSTHAQARYLARPDTFG